MNEANRIKYAVCGWFRPDAIADSKTTFSYHRHSHWTQIVLVLVPLIVLETIGLHVLLSRWSEHVAFFSTIMSIWAVLWILGDYQAIKKKPTRLDEKSLSVRVGSRWSFDVPYENILQMFLGEPEELKKPQAISMGEFTKKPKLAGYENISLSGKANLHLVLKSEIEVDWLFGKPKKLNRFGMEMDDCENFIAALTAKLKSP